MCEHHTHLPTSTEPESLDFNKLRELSIAKKREPAQITGSALPSNKQTQPKGQLKKFEPSRSPQIPFSKRPSEQPKEIKVNEQPTKAKLIQTSQEEFSPDERKKEIQDRIQKLLNIKADLRTSVEKQRFQTNAIKSLAQVLEIEKSELETFITEAHQKIKELFSNELKPLIHSLDQILQ